MSSSVSPPSRPGSNLDHHLAAAAVAAHNEKLTAVSNQLKSAVQDMKNNNNNNNNNSSSNNNNNNNGNNSGGNQNGAQQFCLRWNNYQSNLTSVFDQLLQSESFVDVTLACDGHSIKAHKMVLSACSPYFQTLFFENPCQHPIIIMRDVKWPELKAVVEFMYKGEINVSQDQIGPLLKVAEMLKIRGLAEVNSADDNTLGTASCSNAAASPSGGPGHGDRAALLHDEPAQMDVSQPKKPRHHQHHHQQMHQMSGGGMSKDWDTDPVPLAATPPSKSQRKRRWPSGERSSSVGSLVDCGPDGMEVASPLPPPTNLSHSSVSATPTPIPPNFPLPPQLDPMVLGPLGINHPEEMEIKPGIAEMIREEERVSYF